MFVCVCFGVLYYVVLLMVLNYVLFHICVAFVFAFVCGARVGGGVCWTGVCVVVLDVFDNVVCFILVLCLCSCSYVVCVLVCCVVLWCWWRSFIQLVSFFVLRLCSCRGMRRAC